MLGLFEIHRYNGYLHNSTAGEFLERLLNRSPESVEGLLAAARADLEDGKLIAARERVERLEALAGGRRDVRSVRAALAPPACASFDGASMPSPVSS